jgi:hypothetical protein
LTTIVANVNETTLICGEIEEFGYYIIVPASEVGALKRVLHTALHAVADNAGLSELAVAALVLSIVFCCLIVGICAFCFLREQRAMGR